ncbi:hypothetical protein N7494_013264 [Penicillium frequentans]|uniref:Uncharacterized protein n=1 Tax=Penicillium frequentans TaxID=3151616 RepID=A0AAD6G8V6_9EURO|nr:hypothetical protein N7494_013284 [Penicillium glabrum]KAJ5522883.1 hypothetical protein N7494_013313 [Penicillium glabrum]KAJ5522950.1 hypothetical protein N7494_013264 [Penicillium glabrum]
MFSMHEPNFVLITVDADMRLDILVAVQGEAVLWSRGEVANPPSVTLADDNDVLEQSRNRAEPGCVRESE